MTIKLDNFLKALTRDGRRVGAIVFASAVIFWSGVALIWGAGLSRRSPAKAGLERRENATDAAADLSQAMRERFRALNILARMPSVAARTAQATEAVDAVRAYYPEFDRVEYLDRLPSGRRPGQPLFLAVHASDGQGWLVATLRMNWSGTMLPDLAPKKPDVLFALATRNGAPSTSIVKPPRWTDLSKLIGERAQPVRWSDGKLYLTAVSQPRHLPRTRPGLLAVSAVSMESIAKRVEQSRIALALSGIVLGVLTGSGAWIALSWATKWLRRANSDLERRVTLRTAELATAERSFRGIFENVPLGVYQCDPEGRFVRANPKMASILGYETPEEMISELGSLQAVGERGARKEFLARLRVDGEAHATAVATRADGQRIWLAESARAVVAENGEFELIEGAIHDVSAQRELEDRLRTLGATDPLTGLLNRRGMEEAISAAQVPVSIVTLDVDRFKRFNDTYGHPAGDRALQAVAEIIRQTVRDGDAVARAGGEEFTVVLSRTDTDGAVRVAEGLREAVAACDILETRLTVSAGVATATTPRAVNEAFAAADRALYRAKEAGRNRVVVNAAQLA